MAPSAERINLNYNDLHEVAFWRRTIQSDHLGRLPACLSVCLSVSLQKHKQMLHLSRTFVEFGDFWLDYTPLGCLALANTSPLFFRFITQFAQNLPINWGLSNCNGIHQVAPPRCGNQTAPTGLSICFSACFTLSEVDIMISHMTTNETMYCWSLLRIKQSCY